MLWTLPNLLSLSRVPLTGFAALALLNGYFGVASLVFVVAVATDVADGRIARARGQATALGGLLDHSCDAFFVAVLLGVWWWLGVVPVCLPVLVVLAFLQYVFDSDALRGQRLRTSRIGRSNGVGYYVVVGAATLREGLGADWLDVAVLRGLAWAYILLTLVSMLDRAITFLRMRAAARAGEGAPRG